MPHSKTGKKVEVGDQIISVQRYGDYPPQVYAGTVISITESETCNAVIVPLGSPSVFVTLKDSVHIEDLADFKPDETKPTEIDGAPVGG